MVRTAITKDEPSRELKVLKQRVAELEALEAEYKKAGEKLLQLEDEQRYKAVFESANDVIVLMDKKGKIIDVNDKLREILGYNREKLVGKNLSSLPNIITKKSLDILSDNFQKRVAGAHIPPYEVEMVKKNGELLTLEVNACAMKKDDRIVGNIAILRDVTERKETARFIKESEERLHIMMEASSEGFALHDGDKVFDINENGARMFGYERSEMVGKNAPDFVAPESLDLVLRNIAANYTLPYEAVFKRKGGSTFPVEIKAKNVVYKGRDVRLVSFRDLSTQKQYGNLLETVVVHAPVSMSIVQNRRFKFVNRQFCQNLGYTEEEILSMDVMQGVYPEDRALVRNSTIQMLKGERTEPFEFRAINKDGDVRWVLQSVASITYNGQRASLTTYLDITEQTKAELALRMSEQSLKEAQSLGRIGSWEFDPATQKINWSDEVYRLYERDKALGPPSPEQEAQYYAPEQTRELREYARLSVETGEEYHYDLVANLPSGKILLLNASVRPIKDKRGQVIKLFGTVQDITDRKQAEQMLRENEQKYRLLADNVTDIVWTMDINTQKFNYVSPSVKRIRGYTPAEAMEIPLGKTLLPASHEHAMKVLVEELERDNTPGIDPDRIHTLQLEEFCKDGSIVSTEVQLKFLRDAKGLPTHVIGITRDITERKLADEALKESEENFHNSMDSSPMGVVVFTGNEEILYANQAILDIYGFKNIEELRNTPVKERYTPESYAEYLVRSREYKGEQAGPPNYERSIIRKDGAVRYLQVSRREVVWGGEKLFQLLYNDVTESKKVEEALKNSEGRFRRLAENARDIIFRYRQLPSLGFDYISPAVLRISGYAPEEFYADPLLIFKVVHPDSRSLLEEITSRPQDYLDKPVVLRWVRKDGEVIWTEQRSVPIYDKDGKIIANEGIIRDITESKKAEDALKESEENYRNSMDSSPMGVVVFTGNEEILYANQAILDIYGFKNVEELRNTPAKERFTPESYAEYLVRNTKFESGEVTTLGYELSIRRKDGTIRHLQAFRKEIIWNGENQFQLLYNDITERKKTEDAMRESRARFRELARLLPLAIWETDANGTLTYTNEEAMRVYGYLREDAAPSYLQNLIPEDRDRAVRNTQRILQGETIGGIEYTSLKKDGSTFPSRIYGSAISRDGKGIGLRGITIDVTEQKIAEERLEQAAQQWRTTFDSLTDMVCILDNNFRIVRVNMAYANMLKKEPQELLGKVCYKLIHKTDCPHPDCPHQKTLKTGKPARAEYFESTLGAHIESSTSPIFNNNGDIQGSVHVMRDISERKKMEEQLMLTDRLASVGELASGVAHELNNPLTSVIGFSQLLMEGEIPDNIKEDLSLINSEAQRAANIVKNLLTFARKHAAVKQVTRISNLIEDVLKLRAYEQKVNNIEVIKNFAPDLPEVMVDHFQIQQVFLNLIINAEFFMIEAHHRGTLTINIDKVDHAVKVSFADDGAGIPQENLKRIFDPFFTTKEVGKGTGLGLSICHGIITEHGGKLYAESEVGKGATFVIELPVAGH